MRKFLLLLFVIGTLHIVAQPVTITGKITDATTGESIGFAGVYVKGQNIGVTADFEGVYKIVVQKPSDSLWCSYLGYITKAKPIAKLPMQIINFALEANDFALTEVEVKPKENPANILIRAANKNQRKYNPDFVDAYRCESFSKLDLSIDHLDPRIQKMGWFKDIKPLFDSINGIRSDEGKPLLPVFISETVSDFYYQYPPRKHHEEIKASKMQGVGVVDGTTAAQALGATLQQYNFYDSWVVIMKKAFISPFGDGCFFYYKYRLRDTVTIENKTCYKIEFTPKHKEDLAFNGNIWIADTSFAVMRISVTVTKEANLNFINQVKIQQEMSEVAPDIYLPKNTRVVVDVAELLKSATPSFLAKFTISNRDFVVHDKKENAFFERNVALNDKALLYSNDTAYWQQHRHLALDTNEMRSYNMVDSLRNVRSIRVGTAWVKFLGSGYRPVGKFDLGPYYYLVNHNQVQGWRVSLGARTNIKFSPVTTFKGYVAYGFKDQQIRYSILEDFIISRKKWTNCGIQRRVDLDQAGLSDGSTDYNSAAFAVTSVLSNLSRINLSDEYKFYFLSQFKRNWILKINASNKKFIPYFDFGYTNSDGIIEKNFTTTTLNIELRFARNERILVNDNTRFLLGTEGAPVIAVGYTKAFKGILNGSFNYDKVYFNFRKTIKTGILGHAYLYVKGAKIFGTVPYPALDVHPGNQTFYFTTTTFDLMSYYDFVSDQFISAFYEQYMEGLITNRVPLLKKLRWRTLVTVKGVYGSISSANKYIVPPVFQKFNALDKMPYIEVSYGFENIFRYLRVDFVHRITYRNKTDYYQPDRPIRNFGVLFSAQFNL